MHFFFLWFYTLSFFFNNTDVELNAPDLLGDDASENQAEAPITLKVRDQSGEEMFFKVKKGTAMKKIMQAFADRKGVSLEVLRFTIDGTRVNAEDTPKMLEMEDGDQIDVLLQQLGGADLEKSGGAASEEKVFESALFAFTVCKQAMY